MDSNLVYAKTPIGDEAVRQSTRVVKRNLRMVLVQVDGKMSVADLASKIGNPRLVESALRELEAGGYIAPTIEAVSVWEESKKAAREEAEAAQMRPMSAFSSFGQKSFGSADSEGRESAASIFSSFGKPALAAPSKTSGEVLQPAVVVDQRKPEHHSDRHPLSAARKALLAIVTVLAILIITVTFYPYEQFKPALEASSARMFNAPVKIDHVGITLFPRPSLKLTGVRIGAPVEGNIDEVRIASPLSLLGRGPYQVARIEASGAILTPNILVGMPMFMAEGGGNRGVIIRSLAIDHLQLRLGDNLLWEDLSGSLSFRPDGGFEKASFETVDRSLLLDVQPGRQGIALNIEGRAWTPAGPALAFASLQAQGVLQKDKLLIRNIDTTFVGGILRGNWLLDWSNGLSMAGEGTLSRLDSRKVTAAFAPALKIEGDMSGTIRLHSSGRDWDSLWENLDAVLATEITHGIFHGVDLGEAARRGGVSEVRAGSTKFDRLRSTLNITPRQIVGRDVNMDAGMVTAVGQFNVGRNAQVEGNMAITLQTSVSSQFAPVRIFGTLPDLSATTRK